MALEDLTYRDYWQIFRARWRLALMTGVAGALAGGGLAKIQTPAPIYEATAVVSYNPQRGFEVTTPGGLMPEALDMTSQILLVRSAAVLGNAAKRLELIPEGTPDEELDRYFSVIAQLDRRVEVTTDPRGRSNTLLIRTRGASAQDAARTANTVARAYMDENVMELKRHIVKRREFVDRQLAENERALNDAQLAYERYRREHPLAAIEPGVQGAIVASAQREAQFQQLSAKIEETERQLTLVRSGNPVSDLGIQTIVGGQETARLTQLSTSYTQLNLDKNLLLTEFTEAHPAVDQKDQQLEAVRVDIERELQLILEAFEKQQEEAAKKDEALKQREASLPAEAMELAQLARRVKVYENLGLQLRTQLEDALLKEAGVTGQVIMVSPATPPDRPSNRPDYLRFGAFGFFAGLFAGFVLAVMIEGARFSIARLREIEESLDLPVLGINSTISPEVVSAWVPEGRKIRRDTPEWSRSLALATLLSPRSPVSESFRTLRANLQPRIASGSRVLTATACNPGEGVTTALLNLGLSFAQAGQRVLLVESDFHNPAVSTILGVQREPGLVDLLLGGTTPERAIRNVSDFVTGNLTLEEILLAPGVDNFHVLPCGDLGSYTGELLGSESFRAALAELRSRYDLIFLDSPALAVSADAIALGRDGMILLVYNPRVTETAALAASAAQVRKAGGNLIGLFVNGMEIEAEAVERTEVAKAEAALV